MRKAMLNAADPNDANEQNSRASRRAAPAYLKNDKLLLINRQFKFKAKCRGKGSLYTRPAELLHLDRRGALPDPVATDGTTSQ